MIGRSSPRFGTVTLFAAMLLATGLTIIPSSPSPAQSFLVPFPPPPRNNAGEPDVAQAIASRGARANIAITFLACAQEIDFNTWLTATNTDAGEDRNAVLIAKIAWLSQLDRFDDASLRRLRCEQTISLNTDDPQVAATTASQDAFNRHAVAEIDRSCDGLLASVRREGRDAAAFTFSVNGLCMRAQINRAVMRLTYAGQIGTNKLPCIVGIAGGLVTPPIIPTNSKLLKPGDEDVNLRDMTRVFFLNENATKDETRILTPESRTYLRDKLLIVHRGPGDASYPVLGCGNTEHSTETPSELLDDLGWLEQTVDDIGDAAGWLAKVAAVSALPGGVPALTALLGAGAAVPSAAATAAAAATIASVSVNEINVPETENHRLTIESSRYLKNQIILKEQEQHANAGKLQAEQDEVKVWLLGYMGEIMRRDFAEYNARPYQRYSLVSLLNLADFAEDPDVCQGARMVLEFALTKFALASREGLRVAPYRRRVDAMNANKDMFDFGGKGADHPIAMMLVYAGQSQRLPDVAADVPGESSARKGISYGTPSSMIYTASSRFVPDDAIVDLAIDKKTPYVQRFHHDGIEIYTSTPSFTLAAGGIRTRDAIATPFGNTNDLGTGVPTSFIPSGTNQVDRLGFMRFEGVTEDFGDIGRDGFGSEGRIYDHNTCVWQTFACGINYKDANNRNPDNDAESVGKCFVPGLRGAPRQWGFLNSTTCAATKNAPPFFVARFLMPCTNTNSGCKDGGQFGFFEVVDAPKVSFDEFRRQVVAENRTVFPNNPNPFDAVNQNGHYRMFGGKKERLVFSPIAHKADSQLTGVQAVNGNPQPRISDWPLAQGDVLNSNADGVIRFTNPKTRQSLIWDFRNAQRPKRTPP